ncbi:MAG: DoxX family protein [Chloroflexota bacterium]
MNVALWAVQIILGVAYLAAGGLKATRPIASLAKFMPWAGQVPASFVRFIGVAELLGAFGLILPRATGILPALTVAAALGLVVVQVAAFFFHLSRRETMSLPANLVLAILAGAVAYGRLIVA